MLCFARCGCLGPAADFLPPPAAVTVTATVTVTVTVRRWFKQRKGATTAAAAVLSVGAVGVPCESGGVWKTSVCVIVYVTVCV